MKVKYFFKYVIIFTLFINCSNKKQIISVGVWNVGSLISDRTDYGNDLLGNIFFFLDDGELKTPRMYNHPGEYNATWDIKVYDGQIDSLYIDADNFVVDGKYKVRFLINNVNSRLFMELKNESKEIVLYNYFTTIKDRDNFIKINDIKTYRVLDSYFPQLNQFPDNRKTLE